MNPRPSRAGALKRPYRRARLSHGANHFHQLPFIQQSRPGGRITALWATRPPANYNHACQAGRHFARQLARTLRASPHQVGANLLGRIAADIDYLDRSTSKGYWVGFFTQLGVFVRAGAVQQRLRNGHQRLRQIGRQHKFPIVK
jgi:hypothetical protein